VGRALKGEAGKEIKKAIKKERAQVKERLKNKFRGLFNLKRSVEHLKAYFWVKHHSPFW